MAFLVMFVLIRVNNYRDALKKPKKIKILLYRP